MKGMWRAKSRVVGSLGMPIFFLAFLGLGLEHASMPGLPAGVDYVAFLTPGIIGMTLLFSSMFAGISVLWDKEFGFPLFSSSSSGYFPNFFNISCTSFASAYLFIVCQNATPP
jgi:hypothetical protein